MTNIGVSLFFFLRVGAFDSGTTFDISPQKSNLEPIKPKLLGWDPGAIKLACSPSYTWVLCVFDSRFEPIRAGTKSFPPTRNNVEAFRAFFSQVYFSESRHPRDAQR